MSDGKIPDGRVYSLEIRPTMSPKVLSGSRRHVPAAEIVKNEYASQWLAFAHPHDDEDAWAPANPGFEPPEVEILTGTYREVSKRADEINVALGWPPNATNEPVGAYPGYLAFPSPIEMLAA